MIFWKDIVFPIVIALFAFGLISFLINVILRHIGLDILLVKIVIFCIIWYYVGPIIYNWLINQIITVPNEGIRIIYNPIQAIIETFEKLV